MSLCEPDILQPSK